MHISMLNTKGTYYVWGTEDMEKLCQWPLPTRSGAAPWASFPLETPHSSPADFWLRPDGGGEGQADG